MNLEILGSIAKLMSGHLVGMVAHGGVHSIQLKVADVHLVAIMGLTGVQVQEEVLDHREIDLAQEDHVFLNANTDPHMGADKGTEKRFVTLLKTYTSQLNGWLLQKIQKQNKK